MSKKHEYKTPADLAEGQPEAQAAAVTVFTESTRSNVVQLR